MIAIFENGRIKEVRINSVEMAEALKAGGRIYKEEYSLYLCPSDDNRECDEGSPDECGYCENGICSKEYYI